MKVLGIDPGTAILGYGLVEENGSGLRPMDFGCLRTEKGQPPAARLQQLFRGLKELLEKLKPDGVAVEKLFFSKNVKTAMAVSEARGAILLCAAEANMKVAEYSPLEVKIAVTGYGRAEKRQVQEMVKTLLKLPTLPQPDDAADALALAICHLHSYKYDSAFKR
ncbi:MAG: crossover junction endodeoxyribonuclease RuvC [Candidatus Margulisiibacteriota bacterium]